MSTYFHIPRKNNIFSLVQAGNSPCISIPSSSSSLITSFVTSLFSGQAFNEEEHLLASLLCIVVPSELQTIVPKTTGLFLGEKSPNVEKVNVVDSKSTRKYLKKVWKESSEPFLHEKLKHVRVNVGDPKLKNNITVKNTFEIKSQQTGLQENYDSLKQQDLEKDDDAQDNKDSKLLRKSTFCDLCSKTFANKYILKTHMKNHQSTILQENITDVFLKHQNLGKDHHENAKGGEDFKLLQKSILCDVCSKTYANKYILKAHMKIHEEKTHMSKSQEKVKCEICFVSVTRIKMHMKNIHGERKTCTICGQDKIERKIAKHEKLCKMSEEERAEYKESKKIKCENCPKILSDKKKLARHIQSVHSTSKLFQCEHCEHKDNRSDNMKTHVKNNHKWIGFA